LKINGGNNSLEFCEGTATLSVSTGASPSATYTWFKDNVKVYLDESMKRFETMLPACGTPNSAIELTLEELEKASNYIEWIDVCQI